jgi:hypothetical protein
MLKKGLESISSVDMSVEQRDELASKLTNIVRKSHIKGNPFDPGALTLLQVARCDKAMVAVFRANTEGTMSNVDTFKLMEHNAVLFSQVKYEVSIVTRELFVLHFGSKNTESISIPDEVLRMIVGRVEIGLVVLFRMTCPDWVGEVCDWHGLLPHVFSEQVAKARKFYKS